MNRKLLCLASLISSLVFCVSAQHAGIMTPDTTKTLLWKISGHNLAKPSYLFGTMHILCADDAKLSDGLKKAISDCEELYFEIDLSDMKGMLNSLQYLRMNDETKLSDLLSAADYAKVKSYFSKHVSMLPFGMLERFKPLLISSMIEEQGMRCQSTDGMEMEIMKDANAENKKINGLETVEFQAQLFDSIPYQKQAKDLVNYIDSIDQYTKSMDTLMQVYKTQDLNKINELSRTGDPTVTDYIDLLLNDRNKSWVNKMKTILPGKSILFAVGAAHLPGEKGVIELLRENGYSVTPMKN